MRARHYDSIMGRFIQHDPIGTKDDINLYRYVANNPMKYVDRFGLEKKMLVIGFIGGTNDPAILGNDFLSDCADDSGICYVLDKLNKENRADTIGLTSQSIIKLSSQGEFQGFTYNDMGKTIAYAEDYIVKNQQNYSKISLLGHSLGGDNAVVLSNRLNNHGINIDLLVTIDVKSVYENDTIDSNVKQAVNFYQTNDSINGENIEKAWFNTTTGVANISYNTAKNGDKTSHQTIDNYLKNIIYNLTK